MKTRIQSTLDDGDNPIFKIQTMKRIDTGDYVWGTIKLTRDFSEELQDNKFLDGNTMQFDRLCDAVEAQELLEEWVTLDDIEVL